MSVAWTSGARAEMDAAEAAIAVTSPRAAAAFAGRVRRQLDLADTLPYIGPAVGADPAVRELYEAPYRIVYEVVGDDVVVLSVRHARRRP